MDEKEKSFTFSDLGITKNTATANTFIGKVRSCSTLTKKEIVFLVVALLSVLGTIGITIERLVHSDTSSADFTFAIVLLINSLFCLYYILSGVFFERPYELAVLVVSTGIVWLYLVLNYAISLKGSLKLARLVAASVLGPLVIIFGTLLIREYSDSKSLIFRTVGARAALQEMCNTLFVFIGLLKGDIQINLSMGVLILTSGKDFDLEDKIVLPVGLSIAIISTVLGYLCVRLEKRVLGYVYLGMWVLIPAYAVYLIVKSVGDLKNYSMHPSMHNAIRGVTLIAAILSLVIRSLILYYGFRVFLNFGKGLKNKVFGNDGPDEVRESANADSSVQVT